MRVGEQVRVGGLVTDLEPRGIRIDDGTASALVVLEGDAAQLLPLIEPGDAVNASGTVESVDGELAVVVTDPAGIALAADPTTAGPAATATPIAALPGDTPPGATEANLGDPLGGLPGLAGLGTLVAVTALSVARHMPPAVAGAAPSRSPRRGPSGRLRRGSRPSSSTPPASRGRPRRTAPTRPTLGPRTAEHASRTHGSA